MKKIIAPIGFSIIASLLIANTYKEADTIDLNNLDNYANQQQPAYITKDNTPISNAITDEGATLGRVLFYDKKLSINNTIACASCHLQEFAFSDTAMLSLGQNGGTTGRHAMRLVNARFSDELRFFWDERATSIEDQSTQPIHDHTEMGFSGQSGNPDIDSLFSKMENINYYQQLFNLVYGSPIVDEGRIQFALAQFIRSIQSFDSKYDVGRAQAPADGPPFPNFSVQENQGKTLFLVPAAAGGAGCATCHRPPEFDIVPNSLNNGVIAVANNPAIVDLTNTRSPSLRDIFNPTDNLNGPLMHNGMFDNIMQVIDHYDSIVVTPQNPDLDPRLSGPTGQGQDLNLTDNEKDALIAFLKTLSGLDIYTNEKWSDPFDSAGNLELLSPTAIFEANTASSIHVYPNPFTSYIHVDCGCDEELQYAIYDLHGRAVETGEIASSSGDIETYNIAAGTYALVLFDRSGRNIGTRMISKGR